jgi:hypothetical protein
MRVILAIILVLALLPFGSLGDTEGTAWVVLTLEDVLDLSICSFPSIVPLLRGFACRGVTICLFSSDSDGVPRCRLSRLEEALPSLTLQLEAGGIVEMEVWVIEGSGPERRKVLSNPQFLWGGGLTLATELLRQGSELVLLGGIGVEVVALTDFQVRVSLSSAMRNGLPDPGLLAAEPLLIQRRVEELSFSPIPSSLRGYLVLEDFTGKNNLPGEGYGYYLLLDPGRLEGCQAGDRLEFELKFVVEDVTDL